MSFLNSTDMMSNDNFSNLLLDYDGFIGIDQEYAECQEQICESSTQYDYKYYIDGIALLIVAIFGIAGTLMSLFVLLKYRIRDLFSNCLTALCIFDCSFLIMAIFYIALPSLSCW